MPFSLAANPSQSEISDAINYLLNNFGSNVVIDVNTGIVAGPSGGIGYLYKYLDIKYATSFDGSVGFSDSPTGATYYGSRNNNSSVESTNPADYIWTKVTGGFGTTKFIWYATTGGRQINIVASATAPTSFYVKDTGAAIDLDVVTGTTGASGYSGYSGNSGLSGFSGSSGYSGFSGTGGNGLSALTAYKVQVQSAANPTFTTPTSGSALPTGWYATTSAALSAAGLSVFTPGYVVWYIFGQYNSTAGTINGVAANTTAWTGPTAASIFQDIESDNWNGSTPPTYGSSGTYGTSGYYIVRNTGDVYFNRGSFRGDITGATGTFAGSVTSTIYSNKVTLNETSTNWFSVYATGGSSIFSILGDGTNYVQAQLNGNNNTLGAFRVFNTGGAAAIYGANTGTGYGVYGNTTAAGAFGVYGVNSGGGTAMYSGGLFGTSSNALVTNLYSQYTYYLKRQGSGSGDIYFYTGPTTGASTATFLPSTKPGPTSGSVSWIEVYIGGTSYQIPVWAT